MMKKTYQKPEAELVTFEIEEEITAIDGSTGAGELPPDWEW